MSSQSVGLNEVGGVTKGANQIVDQRSIDVQSGRNINTMAETLRGANFGPAANAQYAGLSSQASANVVRAQHSAEYATKKVEGERQAVQGHEEATQSYSQSASQGESTFGSLNRSI
jgi:hypothetical protein